MENNGEFEYMNEDSINHSLKCNICDEPFIHPVSTNCKKRHKFCRQCIEQWLQRNPSCPTCRQNLNVEDLVSITEDIVVDMLNELPIKCTGCGQTGLERGDFNNHLVKSCPMVSVSCSSKDIECPWIGPRSQLSNHLEKCSFHLLRPLIVSLISENQELKKQVTLLSNHNTKYQHEMEQLTEQTSQQAVKMIEQQNQIIQLKSRSKQNRTELISWKNPITNFKKHKISNKSTSSSMKKISCASCVLHDCRYVSSLNIWYDGLYPCYCDCHSYEKTVETKNITTRFFNKLFL